MREVWNVGFSYVFYIENLESLKIYVATYPKNHVRIKKDNNVLYIGLAPAMLLQVGVSSGCAIKLGHDKQL